ncbi:MAG TPA: pyridoxamine 5'-phosphate oxidase family protein [Candidatus Saccharimonadales bacterium]|nr:pyridoxamine 5'-phosphate oxidase family protein [Candidatus Saccharimonadales bacterium]
MNDEKIESIIREYIPQIIHMSLATVRDNMPWVCEVHFSYDDDLNLYFGSSSKTRHAQEIIANPHVAGNIVTQHYKNQAVRCVDFEGTAEMLNAEAAERFAYPAHVARNGESQWLLNEIRKDGDMRFFKIKVKNFYVFDSYEGERTKNKLVWSDRTAA